MRHGEPWGEPFDGTADVMVTGDDAAFAAAAAEHLGAVVRFDAEPTSDLARAVGLTGRSHAIAAPLDLLEVDGIGLVANMVVSGVPPRALRWWHRRRPCVVEVDDREVHRGPATTVVVANGQFLGGDDVVPRGHPGDGRFEVQVYGVRAGERRRLRARLATGSHVPHPAIVGASGRRVRVVWAHAAALSLDGQARGAAAEVAVSMRPAAVSVLL